MSCPSCPHCTGKARPAEAARLLDLAAPERAIERLLEWVESLRGRKGRTMQVVTLVGHDDKWTHLLVHRDPEVVGGRHPARTSGGGP